MHVRRRIVIVTTPPTVLGIVAIAPMVFRGTHTSLMVAQVINLTFFFKKKKKFLFESSTKE
jgi:hypothetical protein